MSSGSYDNIFLGDSLVNNAYYVSLEIDQKPRLTMSILKNSSLGLKEKLIITTQLLLSPNPTSNLVNIPFEGSKTIQITDLNGKLIQSITTDEASISLIHLEKGEYLISIYSKENQLISSQKIIKID